MTLRQCSADHCSITDPIAVVAANTAVAAFAGSPLGERGATSAPDRRDGRPHTLGQTGRSTSPRPMTAIGTDEMVNSATPTMKVRLRPMVVSRPSSSISPPKHVVV